MTRSKNTKKHHCKKVKRTIAFLDLPRNVRYKIYEQALVLHFSSEDQIKYDNLMQAKTLMSWSNRIDALECLEAKLGLIANRNFDALIYRPLKKASGISEYKGSLRMNRYVSVFYDEDEASAIHAYSDKRVRRPSSICQYTGLLATCKQINKEAGKMMLSRNMFTVVIQGDPTGICMECLEKDCDKGYPCQMRKETFAQMQHFSLYIINPFDIGSNEIQEATVRITKRLRKFCTSIVENNNKVKTLKVVYWSCFDGELESVRDVLEWPSPLTTEADLIDISNCCFGYKRGQERHVLFESSKCLAPLKLLEGRIEDKFTMHGDISEFYINKWRNILIGTPEDARAIMAAEDAVIAKRKAQWVRIKTLFRKMLALSEPLAKQLTGVSGPEDGLDNAQSLILRMPQKCDKLLKNLPQGEWTMKERMLAKFQDSGMTEDQLSQFLHKVKNPTPWTVL